MPILYYFQLKKYYPHEHFYQSYATRQITTFFYTEKSSEIRKIKVFFRASFLVFIFPKDYEVFHPARSSYSSQT